ncbi:hypothetical protein KHQ82_01930 [Mycoplasmatota bacterium]|nr:hypothetical protein KHQ82_01930 [Mycoplasmatota bacterium]
MNDLESILLNSFPKSIEKDVLVVINSFAFEEMGSSITFSVYINNEKITIPYRVYNRVKREAWLQQFEAIRAEGKRSNSPYPHNEVFDRNNSTKLTPIQQAIYYCILTRHSSGYVREDSIRNLFKGDCNHSWVAPFIIRLLGEYVVEIVEIIKENIGVIDKRLYLDFISDNKVFFNTTQSRVMSYWNEYYRKKHSGSNFLWEEYVGNEILRYLGFETQVNSKKYLRLKKYLEKKEAI